MAQGRAGSVPAAGSSTAWSGRAVSAARQFMAGKTKWPTTCGQCGKRVDKSAAWVVGHIKSRALHPELTWTPSNWRIEHRKCSDKSGQSVALERAREQGRREARAASVTTPPLPLHTSTGSPTAPIATADAVDAGVSVEAGFPLADGLQKPPPLITSKPAGETPVTANDSLRWSSHDLSQHPWLQDLQDIPEDSAPPLYMTPVHPDAICSYGWDGCTHLQGQEAAAPWIEKQQRITLRWWQKLSLVRQLEHRADGSLCWRKKIESAPRRAGKSVGLRGGALWRMAVGETLWCEKQTVMHTGSDIPICREIQRAAWTWAEAYGWNVSRGAGQETIIAPGDSRWMVRSQDSVYGYDVTLGMGDEAWNIKPDTINEGLEPATLERVSPQLVLTSTAHRRATSLMRTELANALAMTDPDVLLLLWGAEVDCDPSDPAVWRAASPYWSADRERMLRAKYAAALAGEDDPEFDDPDPMRGFMAQYLNVWTIAEKRLIGRPVIEAPDWLALSLPAPTRQPDSVAVESWYDEGVSVALAWRQEDGSVLVHVAEHATLDGAAAYISALTLKRPVQVGTSLLQHPAWRANRVRVTGVASATRTQVGDLMRLLREGTLRHTGADELTRQVTELRTTPGVDGPRIRSTERADAIKAATWAAAEAATVVRRKVVVPSRYAAVS